MYTLTHCSKKIVVPKDVPPGVQPHFSSITDSKNYYGKPHGLWLAVGNYWIMVSMMYDASFRVDHFGSRSLQKKAFTMYNVNIKYTNYVQWSSSSDKPNYRNALSGLYTDKVLMIMDEYSLRAFHRRYRVNINPHHPRNEAINWQSVASQFAGLFIAFMPNEVCDEFKWVAYWQFPSACIWRPSALNMSMEAIAPDKVYGIVRQTKSMVRAQNSHLFRV